MISRSPIKNRLLYFNASDDLFEGTAAILLSLIKAVGQLTPPELLDQIVGVGKPNSREQYFPCLIGWQNMKSLYLNENS